MFEKESALAKADQLLEAVRGDIDPDTDGLNVLNELCLSRIALEGIREEESMRDESSLRAREVEVLEGLLEEVAGDARSAAGPYRNKLLKYQKDLENTLEKIKEEKSHGN